MSKKILFKLWDASRSKKIFISLDEQSEHLYEDAVLKGSEKLQINGSKLALENDGTIIDDDDVLKLVADQTLILLQPHESWISPKDELSDTVTITSDGSSISTPLSTSTPNTSAVMDDIEQNTLQQEVPTVSKRIFVSDSIFENTWMSFQVPWNKVTTSATKDCEKGNRNPRSISNVIQVVADEMREISSNPPNKAIRIVANKIVKKYPSMFQDIDDDGTVMGDDGSIIVFSQLKERLKYVNRTLKRKSEGDVPNSIPLKQKKKTLAAKAGCSHWQPALPSTQSSIEIQEKLKTVNFSSFDDNITQMLEGTYAAQRTFLNASQPPTILQVKEEWPILLSENGISWHFQKLTDHSISELGDNIIKKYHQVGNFGIKKNYISMMSEADDEKIFDTLKIVSSFFSESLKDILFTTNDTKEFASIVCPAIVRFEEENVSQYAIIMEGQKIITCTSLKSAIQQAFALYYVFNLEYPKAISNTLEIFQRYFLKIYPEQGTKNKKSSQSKIKIISFINKLRQ